MTFAFEDCEIRCDQRELRRQGAITHVEPQVFDLLVHLVRHRDRVVGKEELVRAVWDGRAVSDDTITSRVSAARRAIGDTGAEQRLIRTVARRGFRFIAEVREDGNTGASPGVGQSLRPGLSDVQQSVRFCRTSDGVHLAVASAGHGPPLIKTANWLNHIEFDWRKRGGAADVARAEASITLIREGWGQDNPAARQMFTSLIVPDATHEEMRWFNELERISATAETAVRLLHAVGDIDVSDLLPRVAAPTLVLHSRGDARVSFEHGLTLARAIPNARFVALESRNHLILAHEPAWPRFIDEVCGFLGAEDETRLPAHGP